MSQLEVAYSFAVKTQVAKTIEEALKSGRPDDEVDNDKANNMLDKRMAATAAQAMVLFGQ
jgi:hypothetical protein